MTRGRPLRFLIAVVASWTAARVLVLWPADPLERAVEVAAKPNAPAVASAKVAALVPPTVTISGFKAGSAEAPSRAPTHVVHPALAIVAALEHLPVPAAETAVPPQPASPEQTGALPPVAQLSAERPTRASRFAADAWLVLRPGGGDSLAFGQLGGSQGGVRATYALDDRRRVALSARLSAPVRGRGAEAGVGMNLRPTRLPVHLLVEQRFGLDGGGARPAIGVIAGASFGLPARARIDAYGQGGAVWRRGGFVDGAATVTRAVADAGGARVELGAGAWGAAQRRLSRLDVGPSAVLVWPTAGATLRLQLDYRQRVAGGARPGSGPALSLGGSF